MFTGIVEEIGSIKENVKNWLAISADKVIESMKVGDSIAVNGVCLTVINKHTQDFSVEIMPETKRLTNLGKLHFGDKVNLERALSPQGRFGGHFVQGHIDGIGKLISLIPQENAVIANISAPAEIMKYVVKKCFIAVNGVSLTVTQSARDYFSVSLVTFTMQNSNLGLLKAGDLLNLEVDIIAKYIEKFYNVPKTGSISDLLAEHDYLGTR